MVKDHKMRTLFHLHLMNMYEFGVLSGKVIQALVGEGTSRCEWDEEKLLPQCIRAQQSINRRRKETTPRAATTAATAAAAAAAAVAVNNGMDVETLEMLMRRTRSMKRFTGVLLKMKNVRQQNRDSSRTTTLSRPSLPLSVSSAS